MLVCSAWKKSCNRITVIKNLARSQQILQDYFLPWKKAQGLARIQNFLQDFDFKNLAYQDISKILQEPAETYKILLQIWKMVFPGFYTSNICKIKNLIKLLYIIDYLLIINTKWDINLWKNSIMYT